MITYITIFCYLTSIILCYQRPNHNSNTNNHGNEKTTHVPHSPFGHKWTEPYFDLQMPRNVTSLVGKSAYLGCRVRNLGNKTVAWIRHRDLHILTVGTYTYTTDQRFQTSFHRDIDEWTLQIKWAQKRDAGAYECQISTQPVRAFSVNLNIVDSIISDTDNLLQQYYSDDAFYINSDRFYQRGQDEFAGLFPMRTIAVPTATILGGPDLYVDKGSTINLTCAIKFSPEPPTHIFWYHQDKVLSEDSERGGISFVTSKEDSSKSILLIENADLPDSGKYSCYPSNTEIASIRVHVLNGERPEAMQTSGAARATLIGYQLMSLKKLSPTSRTILTLLARIYSATTLLHFIMTAILLKYYKNILLQLNNWNFINKLTVMQITLAQQPNSNKQIDTMMILDSVSNCSTTSSSITTTTTTTTNNNHVKTELCHDSRIIVIRNDLNEKILSYRHNEHHHLHHHHYNQNHYHYQHYAANNHKEQQYYDENSFNSHDYSDDDVAGVDDVYRRKQQLQKIYEVKNNYSLCCNSCYCVCKRNATTITHTIKSNLFDVKTIYDIDNIIDNDNKNIIIKNKKKNILNYVHLNANDFSQLRTNFLFKSSSSFHKFNGNKNNNNNNNCQCFYCYRNDCCSCSYSYSLSVCSHRYCSCYSCCFCCLSIMMKDIVQIRQEATLRFLER